MLSITSKVLQTTHIHAVVLSQCYISINHCVTTSSWHDIRRNIQQAKCWSHL